MKAYLLNQMVLMIVTAFILMGCHLTATVNRGMLDDNTYYSTSNPNIQIKIDNAYQHSAKKKGYQHQFVNAENHRIVFIHYFHPLANETSVDYYEHPDHWIYANLDGSLEIDRGKMNILGKTWYYRDCFWRPNSASCALMRDLGRFTSRHATLKVLFIYQLPLYECNEWMGIMDLTDKQKDTYERFANAFAIDIKFAKFPDK